MSVFSRGNRTRSRPRSQWRCPAWWVTIHSTIVVLTALMLAGCGERAIDVCMAPYKQYVSSGASEKQIIAAEGQPNIVVGNDGQLRELMRRFRPRSPMPGHVDGKILVYYVDPWKDSEGYVVYLVLSKRGVATAAVFGG